MAGYRKVCFTCQEAGKCTGYKGDTGRNGFTRGIEHLGALRLEDGENALRKHCEVDHEGRRAELSMSILRIHRTALLRQVNQAVKITISKAEYIMDGKTEWHQAPLVRINPMSGLQEEQGTTRWSVLQAADRGKGCGDRAGVT